MTSLLRELVPVPNVEVDSTTRTSLPFKASSLATAMPTTPAPITTQSTTSFGVFWNWELRFLKFKHLGAVCLEFFKSPKKDFSIFLFLIWIGLGFFRGRFVLSWVSSYTPRLLFWRVLRRGFLVSLELLASYHVLWNFLILYSFKGFYKIY